MSSKGISEAELTESSNQLQKWREVQAAWLHGNFLSTCSAYKQGLSLVYTVLRPLSTGTPSDMSCVNIRAHLHKPRWHSLLHP